MSRALAMILREIFALFVDDGLFATAIIGWIVVLWLLRSQGSTAHDWSGAAFFAGLAAILIASVWQRSRT